MTDTTYKVRVFKTEVRKNLAGKATSYRVQWQTDGRKIWRKSFPLAAQAETYRSSLITAARNGEAFSLVTGEPVSWSRTRTQEMTWYAFLCKYVDMKWKGASANYRQVIARALTAATPAMYTTQKGKPDDKAVRSALHRYAFNTQQRETATGDVAETLKWLADHSKPISALTDSGLIRDVLDKATSTVAGTRAAPNTVRKHRLIVSNALDYAVELKLLDGNPLKTLNWKPPKSTYEVDRASVINHAQARRLLDAVRQQQPSGPRLVAFFAVMYYAGLRPEEAVNLRTDNVILPDLKEGEEEVWGELHFRKAAPYAGREWTDTRTIREERSLKHRPDGHSRTVPTPPALTAILRTHLTEFPNGPDNRIFFGVRGNELSQVTYRRAWSAARMQALPPAQADSALAKRPYDLRHACVSTWLNAGVPATQVAQWAGHSVEVLLRIYAKCVTGQDAVARQRIEAALSAD
ncbi:tyrosine-type recombinase/integrase [Herbidospora cretacea]|uniref:tyrosine-type recombinase/integrase n=1 Tax=Herbidospora cretacea TaxID=28444 RepID=UPI0004C2FC65|nr:tyrosine-type recombinase/integrase [Herbidospora cretacea]